MNGAERIADERLRQIEAEGWTAEHDDTHDQGELKLAAMAYLAAHEDYTLAEDFWPWEAEAFKPRTRLNALTVAGALIAAEIDRLERKACDTCHGTGFIETAFFADGRECPECWRRNRTSPSGSVGRTHTGGTT